MCWGNNSCIWLVLIIIVLFCCGNGCGCDNNCGGNCGSNGCGC